MTETLQDDGYESASSVPRKLPPGTPKWVLIFCVVVSGVIVPSLLAFNPQITEIIRGVSEAGKVRAENEKTALGTVLELVSTNTKQILVLTEALEVLQQEKKALAARVAELEKSELLNGRALLDCQAKLKLCH